MGTDEWVPRYNIAPTQPIAIIRQNPKGPSCELSLVRWGLVPWWAKSYGSDGTIRTGRLWKHAPFWRQHPMRSPPPSMTGCRQSWSLATTTSGVRYAQALRSPADAQLSR